METLDRPIVRDHRFLAGKLTAPAADGHQIARPSVVDPMCAAPNAKLVLLRAPAGFGKSTVMLQCREHLRAQSVATAWLTLDRADNDASRFLAGLEAAAAIVTEGDDGELPVDAVDPRTVGEVALQVIARLADHRAPFVLFLDDFEAIHEPGVLGLLRELIEHLPPRGQLVIGSRSLPDLRLGRLRARGQLLEIEASRLRFTLAETAEFLGGRRNLALSVDDVSRLHRKTEGWVAAIRLASVVLERSDSPAEFIDRFSGTEQSIADYLAEDVLARQPADVRDFLLRTSVLKHLEPALCDALVPGIDSRSLLQGLEKADVLLVPLGTDGDTYRYHSLFARFLQAQLAREAPGEITRLHSAAADWYERQGRPVRAIDHALEGHDFAHALALLSTHAADLLAQGRMRLLARWFPVLPAGALDGWTELRLIHIWSICFTRGPWEAMDLLERSGLVASGDARVAPHIRALRPCLLAMMDDYEGAYSVARTSLEHPPSDVPFADNVLSNVMATIVSVMGEHQQARRLIDAARRAQGVRASEFNTMYSEATEGIIDLQEARLRQATARFRLAVTATARGGYTHTSGNAWGGVPYAAALYETGHIDQAAHLLQVYLPLARDVGLPDIVILGYVTLQRIAFLRGDVDQALHLLTELEYVGHRSRVPRVVLGAKLERARMLLLQGNHRAAREELDRAEDPTLWARVARLRFLANDLDTLDLARLRWELHAGDPHVVVGQLAEAAQAARTDSRFRRALKLDLLHAAALHRAGDVPGAVSALARALGPACAEGFQRIVLDEGEVMRPVVHALAASLGDGHGAQDDPVFADYVQRLALALGPMVAPPAGVAAAGPSGLLEPLTRKEIRVLQLLAEGYSNSAMAEKLFVSDSTIRTHLRNINTKLDAHSRTQAVAVARRLGVIA